MGRCLHLIIEAGGGTAFPLILFLNPSTDPPLPLGTASAGTPTHPWPRSLSVPRTSAANSAGTSAPAAVVHGAVFTAHTFGPAAPTVGVGAKNH